MKTEIEFLEQLKEEINTAGHGEGISFNLPVIAEMINKRIIRIKRSKAKQP